MCSIWIGEEEEEGESYIHVEKTQDVDKYLPYMVHSMIHILLYHD